jgi:hypothetical protein
MWGTTAISDEFTGNFGSAFEDTSIGDFCSVALFAEKSLQAGVAIRAENLTELEPPGAALDQNGPVLLDVVTGISARQQ